MDGRYCVALSDGDIKKAGNDLMEIEDTDPSTGARERDKESESRER